jgi:hypothetical protein
MARVIQSLVVVFFLLTGPPLALLEHSTQPGPRTGVTSAIKNAVVPNRASFLHWSSSVRARKEAR